MKYNLIPTRSRGFKLGPNFGAHGGLSCMTLGSHGRISVDFGQEQAGLTGHGQHDLKAGPRWPAAPATLSIYSPAAAQEQYDCRVVFEYHSVCCCFA